MTHSKARQVLQDEASWYKPQLNAQAFFCGSPFAHVPANGEEASLDGHFTTEMLEAIVLYMQEPEMVLAAD